MSPLLIVGVFLLIFILTAIFLRMPIAFSMGATALCMFGILGLNYMFYGQGLYVALDSFSFLAVPFFVFAGGIMQYSGISNSLIKLVDAIAGKVKASLGAVTIIASAAFGMLTGSNMATLSTIGSIMLPEMEKKGYSKAYSAALVAACSYLGTFIPPSVPGIMYAVSSGEKVSAVWLSTVVPGIMFAISYLVYNRITQANTEDKSDSGAIGLSSGFLKYAGNVGKQFIYSLPALFMPLIIFGGIYGGIFTATEAGAVSVLYGIAFFIIKKIIQRKQGIEMPKKLSLIARDSMLTTAMICCMLAFARSAGYTFTLSGVSNSLADFITSNISNKHVFLLFVNIIFLIQGTFIDLNSGILIMTPLLLPTVTAMGINPIHFGAIMLTNLSIGTITPPLASALYLSTKLANADTMSVIKKIIPFVVLGIINVLLITFIPELSLAFELLF